MGKKLRFVGCCHPKARDDRNPAHRRSPQLTRARMHAALAQMKGKPVLDNHDHNRVVGAIDHAWIDGEDQLWVRGHIDLSTPAGESISKQVGAGGKYRGLSLGMNHSVLRRVAPDPSQRATQGHSEAADDWSDVHAVLSSEIQEVSLCEEGKYEHTMLASFFSKNPAAGPEKSAPQPYESAGGGPVGSNGKNNKFSADINAALASLLTPESSSPVPQAPPSLSTTTAPDQQKEPHGDGATEKGGAEDSKKSAEDSAADDLQDNPEIRLARIQLERDRERRQYEEERRRTETLMKEQQQRLDAFRAATQEAYGSTDQNALKEMVDQRRREKVQQRYTELIEVLPMIKDQTKTSDSPDQREMLEGMVETLENFAKGDAKLMADPERAHQVMQVVQLLSSQKAYVDRLVGEEKQRASAIQTECDTANEKLLQEQARRMELEKQVDIHKRHLEYIRKSDQGRHPSGIPNQYVQHPHDEMAASLIPSMASKNAPAPAPQNGTATGSEGTQQRSDDPIANLFNLVSGRKRTLASANAPSFSSGGGGAAEPQRNVRQKVEAPPAPTPAPAPRANRSFYAGIDDIFGVNMMGTGALKPGIDLDSVSMRGQTVIGHPLYQNDSGGQHAMPSMMMMRQNGYM